MRKNNEIKWKGNDVDMMTCVNDYGLVYQHNGDDIDGYAAFDYDEDGIPSKFAPIWISHDTIDDYFKEDGTAIAAMCGVKPEEMDYEWKFDAMLSYYGSHEFYGGNKIITKDELIEEIKDNWFGM